MKKVILAILDGIGVAKEGEGNAYSLANTKTLDYLLKNYPHSLLKASGRYVGLPKGQQGNSEVGHLTIGAGRVIDQSLERINKEIRNKNFFKNDAFLKAIKHAKDNNSKLHILGLLSDGGVHSHIKHIFALIKLAKDNDIKDLYLHIFLDGRDTRFDSAMKYLDKLNNYLDKIGIGKIATISGRYYAMDRERMWDKVKIAYDAMIMNDAPINPSYKDLIESSYEEEVYDEFIYPTIIDKEGIISDDDALIVANFRPDRLYELLLAITDNDFDYFPTKKLSNLEVVTMMPVSEDIKCISAYQHIDIKNTLPEVLVNNNYKVLRIAEVSKFPHVTHFIDGDKDIKLKNTTKIQIPRKEVETYDLYPAMSAVEVTNRLIKESDDYDFIIVNYANCDMVGHTGNIEATKEAVEVVDSSVERLFNLSIEEDFTLVIVSDHGNCEEMLDKDGNILTSHTTNLVNFIVCDDKYKLKNGSLEDVAVSILHMLKIDIPKEMTGKVIICEK